MTKGMKRGQKDDKINRRTNWQQRRKKRRKTRRLREHTGSKGERGGRRGMKNEEIKKGS